MSEKPVYRYRAGRSPDTRGWLVHVWWCREKHNGYWECSAVCRRPKSFRLWPSFAPAEKSDLEAATELLAIEAGETCSVCRVRAEGIAKRTAGRVLAGKESDR